MLARRRARRMERTRYLDRNVRRVLDRASRRAGVPWIGFHTFRHTCASMLFEGGKNIKQVAAWLGHADPAFTLRTYVHLLDDGLGDAAFLDAAVLVSPRNREDGDALRDLSRGELNRYGFCVAGGAGGGGAAGGAAGMETV